MSVTNPVSLTDAFSGGIAKLRAGNPVGGITQDQAIAKYQDAQGTRQFGNGVVDTLFKGPVANAVGKGVWGAIDGTPTFEGDLSQNTALRDWAQQKQWDENYQSSAINSLPKPYPWSGTYANTAYNDLNNARDTQRTNINGALDTAETVGKVTDTVSGDLQAKTDALFDPVGTQIDKTQADAKARVPGLQTTAQLATMQSWEAADQAYAQTKQDLNQRIGDFFSFMKSSIAGVETDRTGQLATRANDVATQIDLNRDALTTNVKQLQQQVLTDASSRGLSINDSSVQQSLQQVQFQGAKQAGQLAQQAQTVHNAAVDEINKTYASVKSSVINGLGSTYGGMLSSAGSQLASLSGQGADIKSKASQWGADTQIALAQYGASVDKWAADSKATLATNRSTINSNIASLRMQGLGSMVSIMESIYGADGLNQYIPELPFLSNYISVNMAAAQQDANTTMQAVSSITSAATGIGSLFKGTGSSGSSGSSSGGWASGLLGATGMATGGLLGNTSLFS
jgi:hypothetical protein